MTQIIKTPALLHNLLKLLAVTVLILVPSACIGDDDPSQAWSLPLGSEMPRFEVTLLDGNKVSSSDLAGSTAVIVLFNTTCPDCRAELPVVDRVSKKTGSDVKFLCIARAEGAESVEQFWNEKSLTLPVSPQPDRAVYSMFAESVIPRVMIFSPQGRLTASFSDSPLPTEQSLTAAIAEAGEK